jgi:outer membrane protein TolC
MSQEQSQPYRDAKVAYDIASRSYEKTLKDNLPLPKFGVNLGAYRTGFDPNGTTWNFQTTDNNKNVELVASINMRWTLLGEGGIFNTRQNQQAYLSKRIAEIGYFNTKRELEVKVRTIYKTVRFLEKKVEIAQFQHKNAQSNYDSALDNYIGSRTSYPDIKLAIDNLVSSHINSENVKYDHLIKKLELSDFMGLEDLPGENFESLASR